MKKITISDIKDRLKEKGISPSIHRVKVLEYLLTKDSHPNVQTIYKDLYPHIPTLSKTTIYNVINRLKEFNLVRELRIEETEVRYDWQVEPHAHFKCNSCGDIYNIDYKCSMFKIETVDGHFIEQRKVNFIGTCKDCLKKNKVKETA